jgi:AcrR family transcriptional regulator
VTRRTLELNVNDETRDRVVEAARTAIAERGLHAVRMAHIAELAGMSSGHILYYFKSKDRILAETVAWSEARLADSRHEELAGIEDAQGRLMRYIELYIPGMPRDPYWSLWFEVYGRSPLDPEIAALSTELEQAWIDELADIIALGVRRGEFSQVDPDEFADRFCMMLGGYSMRLVAGRPGISRESTIRRVAAIAARELGFRPSELLSRRKPEPADAEG